MPGTSGTLRYRTSAHRVPVEVVAPKRGDTGGAILYLHGGAFCLGGPHTHRGVTTRLANDAGLPVWCRLPAGARASAALDDALAVYDAMRAQGHAPHRIVIAGDSAGGALALALAIALRERGEPAAAALLLISPVTDPALGGATLASRRHDDPMIRRGWLEQGLRWYHGAGSIAARGPLDTDLRGLPPMLVQAGDRRCCCRMRSGSPSCAGLRRAVPAGGACGALACVSSAGVLPAVGTGCVADAGGVCGATGGDEGVTTKQSLAAIGAVVRGLPGRCAVHAPSPDPLAAKRRRLAKPAVYFSVARPS